MTITRPRFN